MNMLTRQIFCQLLQDVRFWNVVGSKWKFEDIELRNSDSDKQIN